MSSYSDLFITRPKYVGYSQHDAECIFKCPECGRKYGGWTFAQHDDVITCKCGIILTLKEVELRNGKTDKCND